LFSPFNVSRLDSLSLQCVFPNPSLTSLNTREDGGLVAGRAVSRFVFQRQPRTTIDPVADFTQQAAARNLMHSAPHICGCPVTLRWRSEDGTPRSRWRTLQRSTKMPDPGTADGSCGLHPVNMGQL